MRYGNMTGRTVLSAVAAIAASGAVAAGASAAGGSAGTKGHGREDAAGAKCSAADKQWLKTSISGDRFEIIGGRIAQAQGSPVVKALGAQLVKDHTQSLEEAVAAAKRLGVEVPREPTQSQQWELSIVRTLSGPSFNYWYSSLEAKDHQQDIQETTDELNDGSCKDIKKLAATDLPMLQMHLQLSSQALQQSPNPGSTSTGTTTRSTSSH